MTRVEPGYPGRKERARLFVALLLPPETRERIAEATAALRRLPGVRWGRPEQYHLTLRFLGDVEVGRIAALVDGLREAAAPRRPVDLALDGAGAFPSPRRARVVWAGIRPEEPLAALHRSVEAALAREGFEPDDRSFHPHVTLGRVRRRPPPELPEAIERIRLEASCTVAAASLVESRLGSGGARHEEIGRAPLAGS